MIYKAPPLAPPELAVIEEIDRLKQKLRWQIVQEPRRWFGSLRRVSMARAIQGSNSIEGYDAALDDAAAVDLGEEPLDADAETRLALKGYRDAMTYVLQLAGDPGFAYSDQLLKSLHFMMVSYDVHHRPGLWRSGAIYVRNEETGQVVYEGADADDVPHLMIEFAAELNDEPEVPPVVRAAMAHLNLVMIHPFRDGNGRMARCLQTLVLAREGTLAPVFCSIEEYLGRNTSAYYSVLAEVGAGAWDPERDATSWVRFSLTAHLRQARTMLRRVKESEAIWTELEVVARQNGLPQRAVAGLFDAAMGYRVRNPTYRAIASAEDGEITEGTATRDLGKMVDAGLLEPNGEKRGRYYTGTGALLDIRTWVVSRRDQRDETDPFGPAAAP